MGSLSFKKQKDKRVKIKKKVAAFQINQKKKLFWSLEEEQCIKGFWDNIHWV